MSNFILRSGLFEQPGRIPSLDGLRAISISLVVFAHLTGTRFFFSRAQTESLGDLGNFGVRVFFVISGFLITTLLLAEVRATGRVSLPWFYFRRTLRIFPASYAFSAVVFAASAIGVIALQPGDTLHAYTYTMNYHLDRSWYVGHLWSLSVEEQFYLLWPVAIALLGSARAPWVAAGAFFAAPALRVITWLYLPAYRGYIENAFPTIADPLAIGCVLACVRGRLEADRSYMRFLESGWFALMPLAALAVNAVMTGRPRISYTVGQSFVNLAIALSIHHAVQFPEDWAGRILNMRPLQVIGALSYSIYLWQQLFLNRASESLWTSFPVNILCAALAALASYFLVESPCLRLRKRLEKKLKARAAGIALQAAEGS